MEKRIKNDPGMKAKSEPRQSWSGFFRFDRTVTLAFLPSGTSLWQGVLIFLEILRRIRVRKVGANSSPYQKTNHDVKQGVIKKYYEKPRYRFTIHPCDV